MSIRGRCHRCARCGAKSSRQDLTFHRFPPANPNNFERVKKWAKWCFPEEDWSDFNKLKSLYSANFVLCGQHFTKNYIYSSGNLSKHAIPSLDPIPSEVTTTVTPSKILNLRRREKLLLKTCAKCGITSVQDSTLTFHRFPGGEHLLRAQAWIEYAVNHEVRKNWSTTQQVVELYNKRMVLCSKHFDDNAFTSSSQKKLCDFAVPSEAKHIYARLLAQKREREKGKQNIAADLIKIEHNYGNPGREHIVNYNNHHSDSDDTAVIDSKQIKCDDTQAEVLQETVEVKQERDEQATLAHVCRVCLRYWSDAGDMTPLLLDGKPTKAANALTAFSPQIKISADDDLPMQLCGACAREAFRAERFYSRVEETHARLETLAPRDIVQYSLSLAHYFPKNAVSNKLGEDDESAVISLRYDGDQHLELCFYKELSMSHEVEAATEWSEEKTSDEKNRRRERRNTEDRTRNAISDPQTILFETPNQKTLNTSDVKTKVQYETLVMKVDEDDAQQLLGMEDIVEEMKEEPLFDASDAIPLALTAALEWEQEAGCDQHSPKFITDLETVFRCSECYVDFMTHMNAEHHMTSAHGPVPPYVCHECNQTITTKRLLREHLRIHS